MTPFTLSSGDQEQFITDVGSSTLYSFPPWGGIVQWRSRYVLVFEKPDGDFAFTDISSGIPYGGSTIPAAALVANVPRTYVSPFVAFWSSLPQNFIDVAAADLKILAGTAKDVVAGAVDVVSPALPSLPTTAILVGVGVLVLAMLYGPKIKSGS